MELWIKQRAKMYITSYFHSLHHALYAYLHSTHLKTYRNEIEWIRSKLILDDDNHFSLHNTGNMQESRKSFARNEMTLIYLFIFADVEK